MQNGRINDMYTYFEYKGIYRVSDAITIFLLLRHVV
jgi:hypothetical protein